MAWEISSSPYGEESQREGRELRLEGPWMLGPAEELLGPRSEEVDGVRVCPGCLMAAS